MGLFSKLKDAFFEEEYVEVDEPVVKKKEKINEPIARKVEVDEVKGEKKEADDIISERDLLDNETENNFPMIFDDDDFKSEDDDDFDKTGYDLPKFEPHKYNNSSNSNYDTYNHDYKDESKVQKKAFKPSLNISPVYGIIEDKDTKKEDIIMKKEVRITIPSNKLDIDIIREKAYGDLTGELDIKKFKKADTNTDIDIDLETETVLYDMNNEGEQPIVDQVTIGDASEYFEDLGLQYNIDYKDRSHEEATGRILDKDETPGEKEDDEIQEPAYEIYEEKEESIKEEQPEIEENTDEEESIEDNLFDLIDSMYEEKE